MDVSINLNINNVTMPSLSDRQINIANVKAVTSASPDAKSTSSSKNEEQELLITMKDNKTNSELTAKYYVDKDTNQYVVQFLDKNREIIRQIPAEYMIELAKYLDKYKGLFVEEKA